MLSRSNRALGSWQARESRSYNFVIASKLSMSIWPSFVITTKGDLNYHVKRDFELGVRRTLCTHCSQCT